MEMIRKNPEKVEDLLFPLCCGVYISDHWDKVNFSKKYKIESFRPYIPEDIVAMKNILLTHPVEVKAKVNHYLDHLNGSLAFSIVLIESLYNENKFLYENRLLDLFDECWQVVFWYIQDLKDESVRKLCCDYAEIHKPIFEKIIGVINYMNPL